MIAFSSSGDLRLDRRFEWARASLAAGDAATATALLDEVMSEAPDWAVGWFELAAARRAFGLDATDALARYLALDPRDGLGAAAVLGAGAFSPAFVETLYDQYAPRFEAHLVDTLAYDGPEKLLDALRRVRDPLAFELALDLGCGTGLMGRALAPICGRMDGVDLSANMLAQARATGLYATLAQADMVGWLAGCDPGRADLVIAADSLLYLADLKPVFRAAHRVLHPDGLFAFTVQSHDGEGVVLGSDSRHHVGAAALQDDAATTGFVVRLLEPVSTRQDRGAPVPGLLAVLAPA